MKIQEFKQGKENLLYYDVDKDTSFILNKNDGVLFISHYVDMIEEKLFLIESYNINKFLNDFDLMEKYNNFCKEVAKRVA